MKGGAGQGPLPRAAGQQGLRQQVLAQLRDHTGAHGAPSGSCTFGAAGHGIRSADPGTRPPGASVPHKRSTRAAGPGLAGAGAGAGAKQKPDAAARHAGRAGLRDAAGAPSLPAPPCAARPLGSLSGYLCHVRSNGTLLLVLCVPHAMLLASTQQHPLLAGLQEARSPLRRRVAAVLHLSPHQVSTAVSRAPGLALSMRLWLHVGSRARGMTYEVTV